VAFAKGCRELSGESKNVGFGANDYSEPQEGPSFYELVGLNTVDRRRARVKNSQLP
jgi:hypothetical protein